MGNSRTVGSGMWFSSISRRPSGFSMGTLAALCALGGQSSEVVLLIDVSVVRYCKWVDLSLVDGAKYLSLYWHVAQ